MTDGFCQCGCGGLAPIARQNHTKKNWVKGQPLRFLPGHNLRHLDNSGANNPFWKGGRYVDDRGYILVLSPGHAKADGRGYVYEHILIAEKALGKSLPPKAVVHHYAPEQLVVCQDQAYHLLLHVREKALKSCGHASWRKCQFCQQYGDPGNMVPNGANRFAHHDCQKKNALNRYYLKNHGGQYGKRRARRS